MRIKYILQAPPNASESVIEGTPYWPDDDGRIETTNPNHIAPLKLHGYKVIEEVSLIAPQRAKVHGMIDVDDLGRTGLIEALDARGVSYPDTAARQDLAEIATSWNKARGAPAERPAPAPVAAAKPAPAPPPPQAATPAPAEPQAAPPAPPAQAKAEAPVKVEHDFSTYGYEDLKGWLSARGVAFQGNAAKKVLVGLAAEHHAKTKTAELEAV